MKIEVLSQTSLASGLCAQLKDRHFTIPSSAILGGNPMLAQPCSIHEECVFFRSKMASYSYIGNYTKVYNSTIGRYCCIANNVDIGMPLVGKNLVSTSSSFFNNEHFMGFSGKIDAKPNWLKERHEVATSRVTIGHDVWLGTSVKIPYDVTIGHGAVLGAGAVITEDVPPYAVVDAQGKVKRLRFSDEIVSDLLELNWWEYDIPKANALNMGVPYEDVKAFIEFMKTPPENLPKLDPTWYMLVIESPQKVHVVPVAENTSQAFSVIDMAE